MRTSRTRFASVTPLVLFVCFAPGVARADNILNIAGRAGLSNGEPPTGIKVTLQVDLDRNGVFDSFETVGATADAMGNYNISYSLDPSSVDLKFVTFVVDLLAKYRSGGFDALLGSGPMPMAVTFEREGYSTITKRLGTMLSAPSFDAMLAPLAKVGCSTTGCRSADGNVLLSGFPGGTGITHAYSKAYDPRNDGSKFAGLFADSNSNLLISSGFTEIDLRDSGGNKVHTLSSPVAVRYRLDPSSWSSIVDLAPGTGKVEVPMYSFDEGGSQWVSEANGELQTADGKTLDESSLPAIKSRTFPGDVFVSFKTPHFSSWNVDRPLKTHTCVKGRLVDQTGSALPGLRVYAEGTSYTGTTASLTTGVDGFFVFELMKSELPGEDIYGDGKPGETALARLQVTGNGGVFTSAEFATPTAQASIGSYGMPACKPADCGCVQLPDTQVTVETPRACTVSIVTTYSGKSSSGASAVATGAAIVGASITGELTGSNPGFVGSSDAICQGQSCNSGTSDATGSATFVVPVVGTAPQIKLSATLEQQAGTDFHYYTGSLIVDGCAAGQATVAATVQLQLDHAQLSAMASFIAALGQGGAAPGASSPKSPFGCAVGARRGVWPELFSIGVLVGAAVVRRKRLRCTRCRGR
jgi:hypothetical protein